MSRAVRGGYWITRPTNELIDDALKASRTSDGACRAGIAARLLDNVQPGAAQGIGDIVAPSAAQANVLPECKLRPFPLDEDDRERQEEEKDADDDKQGDTTHSFRSMFAISTAAIYAQTEKNLDIHQTRDLLGHFITNMCEEGFKNEHIDFATLSFVFEAVCQNLRYMYLFIMFS